MKKLNTYLFAFLSIPFFATASDTTGWSHQENSGMSYEMYIPKHVDDKSYALMINLHGCTQKPADLKQSGNWEGSAEKYHMIVVIPAVPNGGVILGCWNFFGKNHTDQSGDSGAVINLTLDLIKNPSYNIDPKKVFISGLSSGAGEAFVIGCLRPDIFSGVGLNSTAILGSQSNEIHNPTVSANQASDLCKTLSGKYSDFFRKQKVSIIFDEDGDHIVNPLHSHLSAEAFSQIYGTSQQIDINMKTLPGKNTEGNGAIYLDQGGVTRLSLINNKGLGHAWAAGSGRSEDSNTFLQFPLINNSYINPDSIDYPQYLGSFFGL